MIRHTSSKTGVRITEVDRIERTKLLCFSLLHRKHSLCCRWYKHSWKIGWRKSVQTGWPLVLLSSLPPFWLPCSFTHFHPDFLPLFQMPKTRAQVCVDRHSQSLDDVRLFAPPAPLGTVLAPDSSHSYTYGLPDASTNTKLIIDESLYPLSHCQTKSFYGRRSSNCLSLDMLGDEQFLEFIL